MLVRLESLKQLVRRRERLRSQLRNPHISKRKTAVLRQRIGWLKYLIELKGANAMDQMDNRRKQERHERIRHAVTRETPVGDLRNTETKEAAGQTQPTPASPWDQRPDDN